MNDAILVSIGEYLKIESSLPKIIVVYGPTACGKSSMAVDIAIRLRDRGYNPHIISADSRQIYRGLDIGTGKITESEMSGIPHHMIDIIDPSVTYSMVDFRRDVDALGLFPVISTVGEILPGINQISYSVRNDNSKIVPILCGGTGLYLDAVLYDMAYPENPPDWTYRAELEVIRKNSGNEKLWQMLHEVDPEYATELSPSNYRYIMRGLEVIRDTGKSKRDSHNTKKLRFSPLFLTPYTDSPENRKQLYSTIDSRVKKMFESGLVDEVGQNIEVYDAHCPGLSTIGYKEVVEHFEGKYSLEETISLVAQHSRNYAKRQITWNKRYLVIPA